MEIKHLKKAYGEKVIFEDLDLILPETGIVRVMGHSGLGKTTLLRIMAGLEQADSGEITGLGRISMVFQENRLLEEESALENVAIICGPEKAADLLREMKLGEDLDTPARELSGGMARRVAIARALARDADTYLFDEPLQGLDSENAANVMDVIKKHTEGRLVILVTHDENISADSETVTIQL